MMLTGRSIRETLAVPAGQATLSRDGHHNGRQDGADPACDLREALQSMERMDPVVEHPVGAGSGLDPAMESRRTGSRVAGDQPRGVRQARPRTSMGKPGDARRGAMDRRSPT